MKKEKEEIGTGKEQCLDKGKMGEDDIRGITPPVLGANNGLYISEKAEGGLTPSELTIRIA